MEFDRRRFFLSIPQKKINSKEIILMIHKWLSIIRKDLVFYGGVDTGRSDDLWACK